MPVVVLPSRRKLVTRRDVLLPAQAEQKTPLSVS